MAVSGGADSLALMALAVQALGPASVRALHVDHGLRPESSVEAELVAGYADSLSIACSSVRVQVDVGPNLEARARTARYAVLPADVCTGHTLDDLAETVLLNVVRGAGLDGLAALARSRPGGPRRPILGLRRRQTVELCARLGWDPVQDAMNADPRFRRVRVRGEVLPLLSSVAERDVAAVLARQAYLAADEADLLDRLAAALDASDAVALRRAPVALARRSMRRWLVESGVGDGHPLDAACVERALRVAAGHDVACDLNGGWRLVRTAQRLRVMRP